MSGRLRDQYKVLFSYLPMSHVVKTQTAESEWYIHDISLVYSSGFPGVLKLF